MSKVIKVENSNHLQFRCPACDMIHSLNDTWDFNGDFDKPTFKPSIKVTWNHYGTKENGERYLHKKHCCHSFITDGKIKYCGDCTHDHSNETMDLLEFDK